MNQYSIQDKDLPQFVVPKHYRIGAWAIVFSIIAVGAVISFYKHDWNWLSRFGALVVIIAMFLEGSGWMEKFNDKIFDHIRKATFALVLMQVNRMPHMYGLKGNETEDQLNQIAAKETKNRLGMAREKARHTETKDLMKLAFQIAALGTALWGFADLLNDVMGWGIQKV